MKVKFKCTNCSKEAYKERWRIKGQKLFCSRECFHKWNRGKNHYEFQGGEELVKCCICNKKIIRDRWKINNVKNFVCSYKCMGRLTSISNKGENHPNWKGKWKTSDGYITVYFPTHPKCDADGYVKEHRLVVEKKIGRYLLPKEVVHHLDNNRTNNKINNLFLFKNNSEHMKFHSKVRQFGITNPIRRQIENRWNNI